MEIGTAVNAIQEEGYTKGFVLLYDRRSTLYNQCLLYYLLSRIESTILFGCKDKKFTFRQYSFSFKKISKLFHSVSFNNFNIKIDMFYIIKTEVLKS